MKVLKRILFVLLILVLGVALVNYPKLNIIAGYAAKNMASQTYIAERGPASVTENDNNVPLIKLAKTQVNEEDHSVAASVYGLMERKAICRDGLGCVLVNSTYEPPSRKWTPRRQKSQDTLPFPYGNKGKKDSVFAEVDYQKLEMALDNAFSLPEKQKTRTVLVAYKDHIIAERYIKGFTPETPILGWSMTKSVWATLFGILAHEGKVLINSRAPVKSWEKDNRSKITLNHLLRMQSGLAWDEDYTTISDVTRMLFMETDMTRGQEIKHAIAAPGEVWNYSSGTTNLLSGILRDFLPKYQEYLDFPYQALIDKVGMNSMLIETDLDGNFVGSSYGWANTRDWAKFGLLYLHRGHWNGEQIFSEDWVDYVKKPTKHSNGTYGAHFWLNAEGKYPGVPKDLYSANGYQGQYVFIIPSKELVIVRTGLAEPPDFDVDHFLKSIVDAIP